MNFELIDGCRSCGGRALESILDLGRTPLADRLLTEAVPAEPEPMAPLELVLCPDCWLVQITATVPPEILFGGDYPYFSSVSETLLAHTRENALELIERLHPGPDGFVLEIASNDGYMLRHFAERGIPVLGVDPARAPAEAANDAGVPTLVAFFCRALAAELCAAGRSADLVIANNVLAHVADLNGMVEGIATMLKPDGQAVIEVPYLLDLLEHTEFDTIYHQHLCYFSVVALVALFRRHGLVIEEVRRLSIHGGSLRLYAGRGTMGASVHHHIAHERQLGLGTIDAYSGFVQRVRAVRGTLRELLADLKADGHRLACYGAAAKGTTLLAYCGIGRDLLDYVVDRNRFKQGRYMPGVRLPILPPEQLLQDRPGAVLLLSWNFADEILAQQDAYRRLGGRFVVPIPEPRLV